jgi:glutaredoxin 3
MAAVTLYIRPTCPYCVRAISLLKSKGAHFETIDVSKNPGRRPEMIQRANGRTTVPQIFIGDRHIGGCDDLHELEDAGQLDALLGGDASAST